MVRRATSYTLAYTASNQTIQRTLNRFNRTGPLAVFNYGGCVIKHTELKTDTPPLFHHDGVHLSDIGNDIFIHTLQAAIEQITLTNQYTHNDAIYDMCYFSRNDFRHTVVWLFLCMSATMLACATYISILNTLPMFHCYHHVSPNYSRNFQYKVGAVLITGGNLFS